MTFFSRCFLALSLLLAIAPAFAQGDSGWFYRGSDLAPDPAWTFGTLPNGLRYAVRRNALPAGQVSIRVRIDAGSLHEEDHERGWAHLVEHMAFRGSKDYADKEARYIWQKLGASFGSDTNASTTPTQTVYQLDLPDADPAEIGQSLDVLSQMMDSSLFDRASVAAERKIVLAEKGRRPELSNRMQETTLPLFFAGLKIANRDPIGTEATLAAADAAGLRAFYERWYRPERTTVIIAGDADPKLIEQAIAKHFGGWRGEGPAPREPDFGTVAEPTKRTAAIAYPGAPHSASLMWLRPYVKNPDTKARELTDLNRSLAARIINRRLEAKARGTAAFVGAGVGEDRDTGTADYTSLSVTARDGQWREGLAESYAIVSDALRSPPSQAEIARELSNLMTAASSAVSGESTVRSPQRADQIVRAIDGNSVVSPAAATLDLLKDFTPRLTPASVGAAMRDLFTGSGPRMVLLSPDPVAAEALPAALAAAAKAAPATRAADRLVGFDSLPPLGAEGREVSRQRIEDMDVTIVRFANGSTLTFKPTDYTKGSVQVQLRFGSGVAGLPADKASLHPLAGIVGSSGLADLDLDGMERLLTGRRMSIGFGMSEDRLTLSGATNRADLADQMRLLATKLAYPRWDAALFARSKAGILQSYDLAFSSASARGGREFAGYVRGDKRWAPLEKDALAALTLPELQAFFDPLLGQGPIEAIVVGDVDLETAVAAMRKSIAALPARAPTAIPDASRKVAPPRPDPKPVTFTHTGDPNQATATIGWTTFGGIGNVRARRALSLAANMFQTTLFERFREVEGASYSPNAISSTSQVFPDYGIFYAGSELKPESAEAFFRTAREIVEDLAAKPAPADIFARAQNPLVSGIERTRKTNGFWLGALEDWPTEPLYIEYTRSQLADYRGLTAEEVRATVAKYVADAGDWSMRVLPAKAAGGGN